MSLDESISVYNFEVEDFHTYFVTESNILVHNSCDGVYYVYTLRDRSDPNWIVYVGRTKNPLSRARDHAKDSVKGKYEFRNEFVSQPLTYREARAYEQAFYEYYGGDNPLLKLLNRIRPMDKSKMPEYAGLVDESKVKDRGYTKELR